MTAPRLVAFDLGKVLVDFDYGIAAQKISARGTRPVEEVRVLIEGSTLLYRFEIGVLTEQEFFDEVRKGTGFQGTFEEFAPYFSEIFFAMEPMIDLQAKLRERGIPNCILSNTNPLAVEYIRRAFPFFGGFDAYFFSYEQGSMKPDSKIYEAVERHFKAKGTEILYLDDRLENIEAALARGWDAIQHLTVEESLRQVAKRIPL